MSSIVARPLGSSVFQDAMRKALSGDMDREAEPSFTGIVKRKTEDMTVACLHLGLTRSLEAQLRPIAEEVRERHAAHRVAIYHNLDDLEPGSLVMHVVVSTERRGQAFDAAREIIERIKEEVHADSVETYEPAEE